MSQFNVSDYVNNHLEKLKEENEFKKEKIITRQSFFDNPDEKLDFSEIINKPVGELKVDEFLLYILNSKLDSEQESCD